MSLEILISLLYIEIQLVRIVHLWNAMSNKAKCVGSAPYKCAKIPSNIFLLIFILVLSAATFVPVMCDDWSPDWHLIDSTCMQESWNFFEFVYAASIDMPHLSIQYKAHVIGQLETGALVCKVVALFGARSPRMTTPQEDLILTLALWGKVSLLAEIYSQNVNGTTDRSSIRLWGTDCTWSQVQANKVISDENDSLRVLF